MRFRPSKSRVFISRDHSSSWKNREDVGILPEVCTGKLSPFHARESEYPCSLFVFQHLLNLTALRPPLQAAVSDSDLCIIPGLLFLAASLFALLLGEIGIIIFFLFLLVSGTALVSALLLSGGSL